ncbi:MAG: Cytochrome c-type protein precursor [Pseudomonadota bacterium]|jgi:cytochrome c peroxidase
MKSRKLSAITARAMILLSLGLAMPVTWALDAQGFQKQYSDEAKQSASSARGEKFFTSKHGKEWSCATCHNAPPTSDGKHASTDKTIAPLAPSYNAKRFTDEAKVNKWFKRNCNDVLARECSPLEKADVMAYLNNLKK